MIAGIDFPSLFDGDNFTSRRTTGHNLYDPESLLTGAEAYAGCDYGNSFRNWSSEDVYLSACEGKIPVDEIPDVAPRERRHRHNGHWERPSRASIVALCYLLGLLFIFGAKILEAGK